MPSTNNHPPTEPPPTERPPTERPPTEYPPTEYPPTEYPPTDHPRTEAPLTEAWLTEPPFTDHPLTEAPLTEHPPPTDRPCTEATLTEFPLTDHPLTEAPLTDRPHTGHPLIDRVVLRTIDGAADLLAGDLRAMPSVHSIRQTSADTVECTLDGPIDELAACPHYSTVELPDLDLSLRTGLLSTLAPPIRFRVGTSDPTRRHHLIAATEHHHGWQNSPANWDVNLTDSPDGCIAQFGPLTWTRRFGRPERLPWSTNLIVAEVLVRMAKLRPGHRLLDPFCGTGTILRAAHHHEPTTHLLGADHHRPALELATQNAHPTPTQPIEKAHLTDAQPVQSAHPTDGQAVLNAHPTDIQPVQNAHLTDAQAVLNAHLTDAQVVQNAHPTDIQPVQNAHLTDAEPVLDAHPTDGQDVCGADRTDGRAVWDVHRTDGQAVCAHPTGTPRVVHAIVPGGLVVGGAGFAGVEGVVPGAGTAVVGEGRVGVGAFGVVEARAEALPLADGCVDRVVANLPFGKQVGSHRENRRLYPAVLAELERVLSSDGRVVLLTEDKRLLRAAVQQTSFKVVRERLLRYNGATPTAYVLTRRRQSRTGPSR
ncbi:ubiquinone/menaquinone biosynthesis C-methylase UbiE [Kribbella aluminosa]|uniref:Ubiquinone/menaquinone biosynthesis C-methylase UbiE n=1 Tax=Kribbella aluminosa TaxID=416017 RepID=A0ABS4USQ7_9ACTN|nr:hypothetical protein [Kribbella aluminosa]MBP2354680.1 ubiquinone/menaquinone biosynthesis C-methylase UbiE [Kribbella aluminosa]